MMAGDGLLVRVRPSLSRISREQALGLCAAAAAFGNGAVDLTNRGGFRYAAWRRQGWRHCWNVSSRSA